MYLMCAYHMNSVKRVHAVFIRVWIILNVFMFENETNKYLLTIIFLINLSK